MDGAKLDIERDVAQMARLPVVCIEKRRREATEVAASRERSPEGSAGRLQDYAKVSDCTRRSLLHFSSSFRPQLHGSVDASLSSL